FYLSTFNHASWLVASSIFGTKLTLVLASAKSPPTPNLLGELDLAFFEKKPTLKNFSLAGRQSKKCIFPTSQEGTFANVSIPYLLGMDQHKPLVHCCDLSLTHTTPKFSLPSFTSQRSIGFLPIDLM